jgi:lipopolysaccharide export system protein LptA
VAAPDKMGVHRFGALCVIAACFAAVGQGSLPSLSVEADSVTFDLRSNSSVSKDITISDGRIRIEAGEGRSTGGQAGDGGSWELRGGVRVAIDSARLSGDAATFRYSGGQVTFGEITGDPVEFESPGATAMAVRGTAGKISFDREQAVLAATGNASFVMGAQEVACDWTFNLVDRTASGSGEGDDKCVVRIPIRRR